jgi:hypothetical protein
VDQETKQPPRRRHLMDPDAPRKAPDPEELARLERVQRIVMSALVFTTILHLAVGLVIAADHVDEDRLDAQVGLLVLGTITMIIGVGAVLAIMRRRLLSPWLLAGLLPGLLGTWWIFYR